MFLRTCLTIAMRTRVFSRSMSMPTINSLRLPLPHHLPPSPRIIPTIFPTLNQSWNERTILDRYNDHLYYDCPSIVVEKKNCAWTSTNYRYKRQRRVRNHPSRLTNTILYRSRRMRLHHRKKWLKKYKYDLLKRLREKIKRRGKLFEMENAIILGKAQQFNAENYVKRELEKAKFYGYRVSPIYDRIRDDINRLKIE